MVSPKEIGEKPKSFLTLAHHLNSLEIAVPEIYASDLENDLILLEDFGTQSFSVTLKENPACEKRLYLLAIDVIIALQKHPHSLDHPLDFFSSHTLADEALAYIDWFCSALFSKNYTMIREDFYLLWMQILESLEETAPVIILRDFHVDNLLLRSGKTGIAECGVIDFQDAVSGHPAYDVMSLLEDARRPVSPDCRKACLEYYYKEMGLTSLEKFHFAKTFSYLAAQRHIKVLGIFIRLWQRDGKKNYLVHLPHLLSMLKPHLEQPALRPLRDFLKKHEILPSLEETAAFSRRVLHFHKI